MYTKQGAEIYFYTGPTNVLNRPWLKKTFEQTRPFNTFDTHTQWIV